MDDLLQPGRVLCNVEAASKKHALEILSQLLAGGSADLTAAQIFDSLISRERLGSTGLGSAVALPHGRIAGLDRTVGAFLRLSEAVDFDSQDNAPVDLIFGMIVPEDSTDEHLEALAEIAKTLSLDAFRQALLGARSSAALYELFNDGSVGEAPS